MSDTDKPDNPQYENALGIMDCIFGLGVALANAGILTREELADAFERIQERHKARPDCQHPARQYPAALMAKLFRLPTYGDDDLFD